MSKSKKPEPVVTQKTIGQLVHHKRDDVVFTALILVETSITDNGVTKKHYTIERKNPKTLSDSLFGFGAGFSARIAVGNFFSDCADPDKAFNQGVTFGYADMAVLEFCNNEMFDEFEAKRDANVNASSNG
jgi:hypothetical protein